MTFACRSKFLVKLAVFACAASLPQLAQAGAEKAGNVTIQLPSSIQLAQYRYGKRDLNWGELRYYCSLGSQTPISLRRTCARLGLRGSPRRFRDRRRGRRLTRKEAYYCGLGNQTPVSLRARCAAAGYRMHESRRRNRRRTRVMPRGRRLTFYELEYFCNLGNQTPYSVRSRCARRGLGGWGY